MIVIQIETDDAVFDRSPEDEVAFLLRKVADRMNDHGLPTTGDKWHLVSSAGNTVGTATQE